MQHVYAYINNYMLICAYVYAEKYIYITAVIYGLYLQICRYQQQLCMCVCNLSSGATYTGFSLLSKNGEKDEVYSHTNDNQPSYVTKETF